MGPSYPNRSPWLRWAGWLAAALLAAIAAEAWRAFEHAHWLSLAWLLPFPLLICILFGALWRLLGSRRSHVPTGRSRPGRRRAARNPKVHLAELQKSGEHWAIMLRLPPEGACDVARERRLHVFDLYRAPHLPLEGCPQTRCKCGYSGLKDRRRRDVLPAGMSKDRRAGAVIAWPGSMPTKQPPAWNRSRPQRATAFTDGASG